MLRPQIDEVDGSSDDEAEDTWLPILTTLHTLLDPPVTGPAQRAKDGREERARLARLILSTTPRASR